MSAQTAEPTVLTGPLLFCDVDCWTEYATDVERVGREFHGGQDFANATAGLCSHCGETVSNGRSSAVSDEIGTAVLSTIDEFLARSQGRNLWNSTEVTNIFLDIRSLITGGTP